MFFIGLDGTLKGVKCEEFWGEGYSAESFIDFLSQYCPKLLKKSEEDYYERMYDIIGSSARIIIKTSSHPKTKGFPRMLFYHIEFDYAERREEESTKGY